MQRLKILLSNDDGYFSPGIHVLAKVLSPIADIIVVAPEGDRSGASNSLTLDRPLMVRQSPGGFLYVNGTPTDCVHLAVTGLLDVMPDMIISGINCGANMGDDTLYSGTVAAAAEGFLLGIPSFAVSLVTKEGVFFDTAARVTYELVERFCRQPLESPVLLNINVPDLPYDQLAGIQTTRLGKRHKAEPAEKVKNPRGESVYWVGPAGQAADAGEGTDFFAVASNFVSITPLQLDLTYYQQMQAVSDWLHDAEDASLQT